MTDETIDDVKARELAALTARLPREIAPPAEAWPAIRAQMERDASGGLRTHQRAAIWQRPAFLIAASLVLVAGSSAVTAVALKKGPSAPPAANPVVAASPMPAGAQGTTVSTLTQFTRRENEYLRRVSGLVAIMESDDIQLEPETVAKVKQSLAIIDAAILEARAALARDPANRELIEMLESTYAKKVDLLQRTTAMARS